VKPGFTLVWNDAQVAHGAIRDDFVSILLFLRHRDVTVELRSSSDVDCVRELNRRVELGALVRRWTTTAAGLPVAPFAGVLFDEGELAWYASNLAEGDWIAVPTTTPDEVASVLGGLGLELRPRETFMRRALADHPVPQAPEGYEVRVTPGDVIEVVVTSGGEEAASGLIAVVGEDAVPHRIQTSPEHRRRGLGSVVMGVLASEAVKAGATDGLLFATEDGLHLYRKLGWEIVSDVVIASNTKGEA
jgi:GNAT superfamily N-acetyltransferase